MDPGRILRRWLDVRPNEGERLLLLTAGAFFLLGFIVLSRSLREASFLESFSFRSLPYVNAGVACLALPSVGMLSRLLRRSNPTIVLKGLALALAGLSALLWLAAKAHPVGVVAFFLLVAVGALMLGSIFWVLVAECFPVRGAKRLFGVIVAGGTAGGIVVGLSERWLVAAVGTPWWGAFLVLPLLLLFLVVSFLPGEGCAPSSKVERAGSVKPPIRTSLGAIWGSPYLRAMALILLVATVASALVDFQFKEYVDKIQPEDERAGFLGAFYGWAGGVALLIQLLLTSRVMSSAGVAVGLGIVPVFLLVGSSAFLLVPGILAATVLRGGDYSLRKSLLRPMMEFLYVPLPESLRRRTKSFIDVVIDSTGEVAGAVLILGFTKLLGVPVRYLAIPVVGASAYLILMSRRMGGLYVGEIVGRLRDGEAGRDEPSIGRMIQDTNLLTASYSRIEIPSPPVAREGLGEEETTPAVGGVEAGDSGGSAAPVRTGHATPEDTLSILRGPDNQAIMKALEVVEAWDKDHILALPRLLARDEIRKWVELKLVGLGEEATGVLSGALGDEGGDFVVRRRIPRVLAAIGGPAAADALLAALSCRRFEVRYRAAVALVRLRKRGAQGMTEERKNMVWQAVMSEVETSRPVWEMQRLLDDLSLDEEDELVVRRVGARGELSLEHTFRMLTLVLDPEAVRAAFHGIVLQDESLKSFALEYLEQVLPAGVRERLWLFIGDVSEYRKAKESRPIDRVVSDLMSSRATLFGGEAERDALKRLLRDEDER